ncbi:MAG: hypothetical protein Q8R60_19030 [Mycobacteriales bacterium]|nr:hypothetical protein [Mycobacteriales bacterium]
MTTTDGVVLRDTSDETGSRHLVARFEAGAILLVGQDIGPSVAAVFGRGLSEYEWAQKVLPADVPRALELAGSSGPVLEGLRGLVARGEVDTWIAALRDEGLVRLEWSHHSD